jgi:hypothetical protein
MGTRAGIGAAAAALALALALGACDGSAAPDDMVEAERPHSAATILPPDQALSNVVLPELDPKTMNDAEIRLALGAGPVCIFRYTEAGAPVLAVARGPDARGTAIVKLNGHLVRLDAAEAAPGWNRLQAGQVGLSLTPPLPEGEAARREADLVFEVGDALRIGYHGFLDCAAAPPARIARR